MSSSSLPSSFAFLAAFLPPLSVVTLASSGVCDAAGDAAGDAALSHALKFSRAALKLSEARSSDAYKILLEIVARLGLAVPPRPSTASDGQGFIAAVRSSARQAMSASDGPALAAFAAGGAAGDLHVALQVGRTLIHLRTAAPANSALRQRAAALRSTLADAAQRLVAALRDPQGPAAAVPFADKLETLMQKAPALDTAVTTEEFKQYGTWAEEVAALIEELTPQAVRERLHRSGGARS